MCNRVNDNQRFYNEKKQRKKQLDIQKWWLATQELNFALLISNIAYNEIQVSIYIIHFTNQLSKQ